MKITLVDIQLPSAERKEGHRLAREPIGLLELGAFIEQKTTASISYAVVDSEQYNAEKILQTDPDIVGFSTYSYSFPTAIQLANAIKKNSQRIKIVFGGPHAGMIPDVVYNHHKESIDACVADEGELGFLDFINGKEGVIRREKLVLSEVPKAHRLEQLLANANFHALDYQPHRTAVVLASRGCTRSCDFCITRLTGYRSKPIESVIDEMKSLISDYNVEVMIFEDPLLNGNLLYLNSLCDTIISEKEKGAFGGEFYAVGVCDFNFGKDYKKILTKLSKAGFIQLNWGIEDPRQEFRTALNKKIRIQADVLKAARDCGIYNRGLLMLPTNFVVADPVTDIKSYTERLLDLDLDEVKVNVTTPFPGTPFWDNFQAMKRITDTDWEKYDTHHLVFDAGNWTQEIIDLGRSYIVSTFEGLKKK